MANDVLITPASGVIEFKDATVTKASITLDASNNLILSTTSGEVSIGTPGTNVYVGDGVNSVDLIFEQNGAVRAANTKTLTIGSAGSSVTIASPLTVTTLAVTGSTSLGTASAQFIQAVGSATEPQVLSAGSGTNIPLVLQPKGTGALQAQATTSTIAGGNARGINAVDWQTSRGAATQVASGSYSVVGGGQSNLSSAFSSAVLAGIGGISTGSYSIVGGGLENTTRGPFAGVFGGFRNQSNGYYNFTGGGYNNAGTAEAAVTTQAAATNGVTSGSATVTLAASNASIRVGQLVTGTGIVTYPNDTYVSNISGTTLTLSQNASATGTPTLSFFTPHGVIVGGGNNQATGTHSFVGGGGWAGGSAGGTATNRATGSWSTVSGGSGGLASGSNSFVGGGGYEIGNGNTASGQSSAVVGGYTNTASGFTAVVLGGNSNTATGNYGVVGGASNTNNAANGVITGGQYGNARGVTGYHVFPACSAPIAAVSGVSQAALVILARQTTDATATALTSDSSAAGTINQVILPNNSAYYFKGSCIANVTGGGNTKAWSFEGAIKRGANAAATSIVGGTVIVNTIAEDAGATTWTLAITADTTNGGVRVTATGQAATTIRWVCSLETTEVTY